MQLIYSHPPPFPPQQLRGFANDIMQDFNVYLRITVNYPHPNPVSRCNLASGCSPIYAEVRGQFCLHPLVGTPLRG